MNTAAFIYYIKFHIHRLFQIFQHKQRLPMETAAYLHKINPVLFIYEYPLLSILLAITVLYLLWYYKVVVRHPLLYGGKDGLKEYLMNTCPILSQPYRPTIWAWHYHGTTIVRPIIQKKLSLPFNREILRFPDGGQVGLDWVVNNNSSEDNPLPILLIVPGLSGDSSINYVQHFARDGLSSSCHSVVFNQRGMGNVPLTTSQFLSACNIEDLELVLDAIQERYPNSPIIAVGVSLGGIILTHYLHAAGRNSRISAAVVFSTPWSPQATKQTLEDQWLNRCVYIGFLLMRIKTVVKRNLEILEQDPSIDVRKALKATRLTDFDAALTVPSNGFNCPEQYYEQSSIYNKLSNIRVPLLCIMAKDDPFAPSHSIPISEFETNPNTVLLLTKHGGHFGFLEGVFPRNRSWMNRIVCQFIATMKEYRKS